MSFANPYNFVAIKENEIDTNRQKEWIFHEKLGGYCGEIICDIKLLSNFITAGTNNDREKKQLRINGNIGIQATSLKGMLRSTAEAISNSCLSMMTKEYEYRFNHGMPTLTSPTSGVIYKKKNKNRKDYLIFDHKSLVRKEAFIESCDNKNGLCICCRIFGTTAKENKSTDESFTFKGKIRFSDAIFQEIRDKNGTIRKENPIIIKYLARHSLSNPKNHHEGFYLNENKIKGRKGYYHQKADKLLDNKQNEAISVELVKKESIFLFKITFENLSKEEYGLLLTALELEAGLGHKIGMGKPLGLGSCNIKIKEIKEFTKNRYLSINNSNEIFNESKGNLQNEITKIKSGWGEGIPPDLRCLLTIDNGFVVRYPNRTNGEFKKPLHYPCKDFSGKEINPTASVKNEASKSSSGYTRNLSA